MKAKKGGWFDAGAALSVPTVVTVTGQSQCQRHIYTFTHLQVEYRVNTFADGHCKCAHRTQCIASETMLCLKHAANRIKI